jgi:hypothetical protein
VTSPTSMSLAPLAACSAPVTCWSPGTFGGRMGAVLPSFLWADLNAKRGTTVSGEAGQEAGFDLRTARLGDFYPSDEVLAEIGRVTIAAGRIDLQLALILVAIKCAEPLEVLLTWSSSRLHKQVRKELERLFEEDLLELAVAAVDAAVMQLDKRHVVVHSLWEPNPRDTSFKVDILAGLTSQDELDELVTGSGSCSPVPCSPGVLRGPGRCCRWARLFNNDP